MSLPPTQVSLTVSKLPRQLPHPSPNPPHTLCSQGGSALHRLATWKDTLYFLKRQMFSSKMTGPSQEAAVQKAVCGSGTCPEAPGRSVGTLGARPSHPLSLTVSVPLPSPTTPSSPGHQLSGVLRGPPAPHDLRNCFRSPALVTPTGAAWQPQAAECDPHPDQLSQKLARPTFNWLLGQSFSRVVTWSHRATQGPSET